MAIPLEVGSKAHRAIGAHMIIIAADFNSELICKRVFATVGPKGNFKNFCPIQGFSLTIGPIKATE